MMAYKDSYIVALLVDGKIQKESKDGIVLLPFGSEYVIRLKNKLRKRAVADIWIDGKASATGIVVDANGTVDLERFVSDGNLSEGKKFKLVRVNDPKVDQPDDSENGSIEVNFYPEKDAPVIEKTIIHEYQHNCWHHNGNWIGHCYQCCNMATCLTCHPNTVWYGSTGIQTATYQTGTNIIGGDLTTYSNDSSKSFTSSGTSNIAPTAMNAVNASLTSSNMQFTAMNSTGEDAATVEGSTSLQKFSSIYIDVDRSKSVTIRLTVKGVSKLVDICHCGFKRTKNVKYCPNDGNQLVS